MEGLAGKLIFRGQDRIAIINAPGEQHGMLSMCFGDARIDTTIDARFLYEFIIVFVSGSTEVKQYSSVILHNLAADGVLWFVYPKKDGSNLVDIDRNRGWETLQESGFRRVSQVTVDDTWSALRFRNVAYIRHPGKNKG